MERRRRILIVENRGFVADALVELLGAVPGFEVVGAANSIRDAHRILANLTPDIAVADLLLEDGSAVELLHLLRRERMGTRMVVFTALQDAFAATEALSAGARGYVLKVQPLRELIEAIDVVSAGRRYVSPRMASRLAPRSAEPGDPVGLDRLSRRELEILRLIAGGQTSTEIAACLCISTKTIDTHRSNMYRKLALRNTVDLMRFAAVHGIGITALAAAADQPDAPAVRQDQGQGQ